MQQPLFTTSFVFLLLLFTGSLAWGQGLNPAIRDELLAMEKADQEARLKCTGGPPSEQMNCFIEVAKKIDEPNAKRLTEIFDTIGLPDTAKVGRNGFSAFMILLQHVTGTELREKCLKPITLAFENKELPPMAYANFVDRLLVNQGKKQIYGSNFDIKEGRMVMSPTVDPKKLARRRAEIGLPALDEYIRELKEMYHMEVVVPENE
jgi:hypothetical protein